LTQESYQHLVPKCDGHLITKTRYRIPDADAKPSSQTHKLFIELDVFHGELDGLLSAEVEFDTEEEALSYSAPEWFTKEVTDISTFHNSQMSKTAPADILKQAHALLNSD
jgi:CYTH domain-containing protein